MDIKESVESILSCLGFMISRNQEIGNLQKKEVRTGRFKIR
jgi:hypothetical protein